jgi:hypothetical protein
MKRPIFGDTTPCSPVKVTDFPEEHTAFIFRTRKVPSKKQHAVSLLGSLKMEVTRPLKTSDDFHRTTRRYIPQDRVLHGHCWVNVKSCIRIYEFVFLCCGTGYALR